MKFFRVFPLQPRSIPTSNGVGLRLYRPLIASFLLGVVLTNAPTARAQFGFSIPGLPTIPGLGTPSIPGLDSLLQEEPPITTSFRDTRNEIVLPDDFALQPVTPLTSLPRSARGGFLLSPGFYEAELQSYCLHAGTHGPSHGQGYLWAPLKGPREPVIQHILQNSVQHPDIDQHEIQSLIWSILARAPISELSPSIQRVASQLLTPEEIADLNGGALGVIPPEALNAITANLPAPVRQVLEAENQLRQLFSQATADFTALEQIAVLAGDPPAGSGPEVPLGRWSQHPGGFYVRYFPSGYSRTRVQVYVPEATPTPQGSLPSPKEFDPSSDVAVPSNTSSQRLAQSARPSAGDVASWPRAAGDPAGH